MAARGGDGAARPVNREPTARREPWLESPPPGGWRMSSPIIGWAGHRGLRYGPAMDDEDGYFGEQVAATYDDSSADMFDPALSQPRWPTCWPRWRAAGGRWSWASGPAGSRCRWPAAACEVHGIDLSRAMVARLRAKPGGDAIGVTIGDFATTRVDGTFSRRLPGLQHDHEPDHAGRAGGLLPQRRGAPGARRLLRHRGRGPRAAQAAARAERAAVPGEPDRAGRSTSTTSPPRR